MRTRSAPVGFALLFATLVAGACGSLDKGTINIVDAQGGSSLTGGGGGANGMTGGSKSGSSGGSMASGGNVGAGAASDGAGQAGAGGEGATTTSSGGTASGGTAGTTSQGGRGGTVGSGGDAGNGGVGGEAGSSPGGCVKGSDCIGTTPICDAITMQCRACTSSTECKSDDTVTPFCRAGSCVGCLADGDCTTALPVCGAGNKCRTCTTGSECGSLACTVKGQCAATTQVVYALAQTGLFTPDCGTIDKPCGSLATAAGKLGTARPYLVLVATQSAFNDGATLPANTDITVFGNHVKVAPYDGTSAFTINGGNVTLDDVVTSAVPPSPAGGNATIACTGAKLKLFKGSVSNSNTDYQAVGLRLSTCDADVQQATFTGSVLGISSSCGCTSPTQTLTVERSLFQGNKNAIAVDALSFLIRNNLFLRNGNASYVDIVNLRGVSGVFSFNTMVGNENNCSYEGGLVSCEGGAASCGTFSSNLSWSNMLNPTANPPTPCFDQVYYSPPALSNSLAETTWPGTGNISADPKFVDPSKDNYTPGAGSPALNKGSTSTAANVVPTVDDDGNARGSAPDIGAIEAQ